MFPLMPMPWGVTLVVPVIAACCRAVLGPGAGGAGDEAAQNRAPLERLALERLAVTHLDVLRIQATRAELPGIPGLTDFRAVLHIHASDSSHTGGTREELLAAAKKAGVRVVLLTDHYRPPRDFVTESWRGLKEGVLFLPGCEVRGFLVFPTRSILGHADDPIESFVSAVRADGGLIFLSHLEERLDHSTVGLDGVEIYNRHWDAERDKLSLLGIVARMTDPVGATELTEALRRYPDEVLAFQVQYPKEYLSKWDADTAGQRLTGIAANDSHQNQTLLVRMTDANRVRIGTNVDPDDKMEEVTSLLRPGIRELTRGHQPGDVLLRLEFDPYYRSLRGVATHLLAPELTEEAVREALRQGRAYVSHDWMCDGTGFLFWAGRGMAGAELKVRPEVLMGDEVAWAAGLRLKARFPVECCIRLLRGGKRVLAQQGRDLDWLVTGPGVYRVEGWFRLDGEDRPWLYSNPIYVR
jgi:hypothetical protein